MAQECNNILHIDPDSEQLASFFEEIKASGKKFGELLIELESKGVEEGVMDQIDIDSGDPRAETASQDFDYQLIQKDPTNIYFSEFSWSSSGYPSIIAVIVLSRQFPDIDFNLDYDRYGEITGNIMISNGELSEEDTVDYDAQIGDLLFDGGMLDLDVGGLKQVGRGMVDIECTDLQHTKDGDIKTFNVQFQCDGSPVFKVLITNDGHQEYIEYSDKDGNENIEDNGYADEMRTDLQ